MPIPVLLNASKPQAIGCCEVLNRLAYTNNLNGENMNDIMH